MSASLNAACAFSTNSTISPICKILLAILSAENSCNASTVSPIVKYLIGTCVIALTDNTAPALPSPSILVSTKPVKPIACLKLSATFAAIWPVNESTTNKVSIGFKISLTSFNSAIRPSSTSKRPAVSTINTS